MMELENILASPIDGTPLRRVGDTLKSDSGHEFPIVQGIPIMLLPDTNDTIGAMAASRVVVAAMGDSNAHDPYYLDTLGLTPEERTRFRKEAGSHDPEIDPVAAFMIGATNGILYKNLVGRLPRYPIPHFRLADGKDKLLLDLGCNWGRWCVAAARSGFLPIGLDPQFGAVLAAKRVAEQLGVKAFFVCGDARHLPFRHDVFDTVFSYSVLQHLPPGDVLRIAHESRRVLKAGGEAFIQMPNTLGIRCLQHQIMRRFREPQGFEVRYWGLRQLRTLFEREIGATTLEIDCFFGLGLQGSDVDLMRFPFSFLVRVSELLRRLPGLLPVADSVYVRSHKRP